MSKTITVLAAALIALGATAAMAKPMNKRMMKSFGQARAAVAPDAVAPRGFDSNAVYVSGRYRGTDPDPNVRAALRRDNGRGGN